jgi:Uma2 family endonuclease
VLAPDWAFISKDRVPHPFPDGFLTVIPDMILETRSPRDTSRKALAKIHQWLDGGVTRALELNPKKQELTIYRKDDNGSVKSRVLSIDDALTDEELLPGFSLEIRRLFPH